MRFRLLPLIAVALGMTCLGADWAEFRGPTRDGHSTATHVPMKWSATENVAWKTAIPGSGWSSPVVSNGKVYLTTAVPVGETKTLSLRALQLDAKSGAILWNVELFQEDTAKSPRIHGKNGHASPTPVVAEGVVYVHFGHMGTAALDLKGKVLWRQEALHYTPIHGNGGSPLIVGDLLFCSCDGGSDPFVVALKRKTGEVAWKTARVTPSKNKFSFSTAQAITVDGKRQIISPGSGAVCAYDPADGHELWRVRYGDGYSVIPQPVYGHGLLFIGTGYDRPLVYAVKPGGTGDLTDSNVAWKTAKGAPNTPSLLLVGDELYFVSDAGIASCVDARTGTVHWSERLGGDFSASPVFADGRIYFQNESGVGFVVKPGKTFELLAKNDLGERSLATYAVVDSALFIRTAQHLYRIQNR